MKVLLRLGISFELEKITIPVECMLWYIYTSDKGMSHTILGAKENNKVFESRITYIYFPFQLNRREEKFFATKTSFKCKSFFLFFLSKGKKICFKEVKVKSLCK